MRVRCCATDRMWTIWCMTAWYRPSTGCTPAAPMPTCGPGCSPSCTTATSAGSAASRRAWRKPDCTTLPNSPRTVHPPQEDQVQEGDVMLAIQRLSVDFRAVLLLVAVEDLSYAEAAQVRN